MEEEKEPYDSGNLSPWLVSADGGANGFGEPSAAPVTQNGK